MQRTVWALTLLGGITSYGMFQDLDNIAYQQLNPVERLLYWYVQKKIDKGVLIEQHVDVMRKHLNLLPEDSELSFSSGQEHQVVYCNVDVPEKNGYPNTYIYVETETSDTVQPAQRLNYGLSVLHDIDHALAQAEYFSLLKRSYRLHPKNTYEDNETARFRLMRDMDQFSQPHLLAKYMHYQSEVPLSGYQEQLIADADLRSGRISLIPGLQAWHKAIAMSGIESLPHESPVRRILPRAQRQYWAAQKACESHSDQKTLLRFLKEV